MLGEAELKGFIPAAVMPERPSFFGRSIFHQKRFCGREPDAEPFLVYSMNSPKERERKAFPGEPRERLQWAVRAYRELKSRRFERP